MLRALIALLLLALWIGVWIPVIAFFHALNKKKFRNKLIRLVNRGIVRIAGVKVTAVGEVSASRPLMLVSNHLSYMDVWVLGSVANVAFVPKAEIANWPVASLLCKLMDCVFVERKAGKIHEGQAALETALDAGTALVLFPEATTGDGKHLLPFKPAFFEIATRRDIAVQPVAVVYKKINGLPIDIGQWPLIAWYGDMLLLPHIFTFFGLGKVEVEVRFLAPLERADDRKTLASNAQTAISHALTGETAPLLTKV